MILTPCLQQQHGTRGQQHSSLAVRQVSAAASKCAKQAVWEAFTGCRLSWPDGRYSGLPTISLHCVSGELTVEVCPWSLPPHTELNKLACRSLWWSHRCPQLAVAMPMCSSRYRRSPSLPFPFTSCGLL